MDFLPEFNKAGQKLYWLPRQQIQTTLSGLERPNSDREDKESGPSATLKKDFRF